MKGVRFFWIKTQVCSKRFLLSKDRNTKKYCSEIKSTKIPTNVSALFLIAEDIWGQMKIPSFAVYVKLSFAQSALTKSMSGYVRIMELLFLSKYSILGSVSNVNIWLKKFKDATIWLVAVVFIFAIFAEIREMVLISVDQKKSELSTMNFERLSVTHNAMNVDYLPILCLFSLSIYAGS